MLMDLSANYLMASLCLAPVLRGNGDVFHWAVATACSFTSATRGYQFCPAWRMSPGQMGCICVWGGGAQAALRALTTAQGFSDEAERSARKDGNGAN